MIRTRYGLVVEVRARQGLQECLVRSEGSEHAALNLESVLGAVSPGERVLLNTTAVDLGLGTGGYHLVMARCPQPDRDSRGPGHLIKLRYSPWQIRVTSCEEAGGQGHEVLREAHSLDLMPVVCCGLHSQVLACLLALARLAPGLSVAYVVNDAGCLPIGLSRGLASLRQGELDLTVITAGHAFGGDLEAVNVHSALLAARHVSDARVAVVGMGPGVAGTGTFMGHSEIRQGEDLNAAAGLGGIPLAVPRISEGDPRSRHRGISHHTLAVLGRAALAPALVVLPHAGSDRARRWRRQLESWNIPDRHTLLWLDPVPADRVLAGAEILSTMGRGWSSEPWFFRAAGLAGAVAALMAGGASR